MASSNRYGARRPVPSRSVLPVITVVCDDTRTAVAYFEVLKHEVKTRLTVHVHPAPISGAAGIDVIRCAAEQVTDEDYREVADRVYAIIDADTNAEVDRIRSAAQKVGVVSLFSDPCFEVWTLAHLFDTGQQFQNCRDVLHMVGQRWKATFGVQFPAKKAQADYAKLMQFRDQAIARSKRRPTGMSPSWTEVWIAVEAIVG